MSQRSPKSVPSIPTCFPNCFSKSSTSQSSWGCLSQTGPKKQEFPKDVSNCVRLKFSKLWVSKASQSSFSTPSQNQRFPKHVPNRLPRVSQTMTYSHTVSPGGPRGSNSNVVQRSRNNDGIACTTRAVNNTASAKCYCGKLHGRHVENSAVGGSIRVWGQWEARACLCIAQGLRV